MRPGATPETKGGKPLKSFAILTTTANELIAPLHHRMPVLLAPVQWPAWLGEIGASKTEWSAMLRPYPSAVMSARAVVRRVGNARNDDPDLLTPLAEPIACAGVIDGIPAA